MPLTKSGAHLSSLSNLSLDEDAAPPAGRPAAGNGASRFHPGSAHPAGHHHPSGLPMHP